MWSCHICQILNLQKPHFIDLHQDIAQTLQDHISIDLLGAYNVTSQGNSYTLTSVCNLKGYLMITPIKYKKMMTVANHLFLAIILNMASLEYYTLIITQKLHITYRKPFPATWHKKTLIVFENFL